MTGLLAVLSTPPEGFHAPGTEIFQYAGNPELCLIGSGPLCIQKVTLLMLLSAVAISAFFLMAFRAPRLVPRGVQGVAEGLVDIVRRGVVLEVMGPDGLPFLPLLTTLFVFIWVNNSLGIIPLIQFPTTSRMAIPAVLAGLVWLVFNVVGIVKQGGLGYLKNVLFPPGVPAPIYVLVTPIEFVSTFLVRPLTLAVRLGANMIAGHLILTIFAVGCWYLFSHLWTPGADWVAGFGVFSFALLVFMTGFEVLVAFLQAYIFTMLTAVYIAGAMHPEH
ncbi:MAG: ATP synthase subunit a [Actinomycetota bacterium]|nr:MAG: ATP synthase subunit a [Actinomycetota bacterium]